eukprot:RCo004193
MSALFQSRRARVLLCYAHDPYSLDGVVGVFRYETLQAQHRGCRSTDVSVTPNMGSASVDSSSSSSSSNNNNNNKKKNVGGVGSTARPCSHSDYWKRLRVNR